MVTEASDPFDLQRFVDAQNPVYATVLSELSAGQKRTHWMWFIFPQIGGLGSSAMSRRYAISSLQEARVFLDHPILGARLRETTRLVTVVKGRTVQQMLGSPDDMKFHSSMTLFAKASADDEIFRTALRTFFDGKSDAATLARL
ncbi:DUF1810 domain-containing protein [Rhodopila sp.]|uniref:DUF1810 domain-containing protein n=1 Tax=Rhodopila sp. TaxID=2480087 RepID=UPI003D139A62